jgi:dipeptidyl-peptidase 4
MSRRAGFAAALGACTALGLISLRAQSRLPTMPGYDEYARLTRAIPASWTSGARTATWDADSRSFTYPAGGHFYRFDVAGQRATEIERPERRPSGAPPPPARGRQYDSAASPDGRHTAFYRDRNLWLRDESGERPITTDGSEQTRIKSGTASWVYGEELDQPTSMWWSPDSRRIAFYRFDESAVPDYYVPLRQTAIQDTVDREAYPTAGSANPVVDLMVYDLTTGGTVRLDVRDGQPFRDDVVGYYVYHVRWSPDGSEILFDRTNRRQNVMELAAANPVTGACRTIIREARPESWTDNHPTMYFLADGHRFVWTSERTGWANLYLYDLSGRLIAPLTKSTSFDSGDLVRLDEAHRRLFYLARDGDNYMKRQLHRVGLDGRGDVRLTDAAFDHDVGHCEPNAVPVPRTDPRGPCGISPDGRYFVDVYETHDIPPSTRVADAETGRTVAQVATGEAAGLAALGIPPTEMFAFPSADGTTTLHGLLRFPPHFDPSRKYALLLDVYAGPELDNLTASEAFTPSSAITGFGFLVATLSTRGVPGLGKRAHDEVYLKLGRAEVDDLAAGVEALDRRPYVDASRVGIYGTSYGAYAALLAVLRYPDLFDAASASSPVTAWQNYDTIYTERYMWTPQGNPDGYTAGSALTYAASLRRPLLLYYGTADNNVHPSNTLQLVQALQDAGRSYDLQVGPDLGHSGVDRERMLEFFIDAFAEKP